MPNQQLRDYIANQLRLGVTKEAVRATLIQSGWAEVDINDAMNEASTGPPAVASIPRVATREPQPSAPASGVLQLKEPMFDPNAVQSGEGKPGTGKISRRPFVLGAAGVAVLALLGGAGVLLWDRLEFQKEIETLTSRNSELAGQVATLTKDSEELSARVAALTNDNKDLELQLSFFAVPSDGSTSTAVQAVPVTIAGRLTLSTSADQYVLTTNRDVRLFVGSSKDPKVDEVLRPYIRSVIEVSGTHLPGERLIKVTHVNGSPIE